VLAESSGSPRTACRRPSDGWRVSGRLSDEYSTTSSRALESASRSAGAGSVEQRANSPHVISLFGAESDSPLVVEGSGATEIEYELAIRAALAYQIDTGLLREV